MATSIGVKLGIDGEAEYRKQLNNIVQTTKTLDKQLAEVASAFDDEADAMEKNSRETELLQQKAEKLTEEVEMMQRMVDAAAEKYGESSTECQKWEQSLAQAQTELNNTNSEIEAHQQAAEEANSALGQLTSTISEQESELASLRDEYVNAVLEFGEGSDEADALAGRISNLSGELQENKTKLDNAKSSLKDVETAQQDTGKSADEMAEQEHAVGDALTELAGNFGGNFSGIVETIASSNVAGLMMEIADRVLDIVQNLWEMQLEFDEAVANVAVATGAAGDDLDQMKQKALEAWAAVANKDADVEDYAEIVANLNTRLGATGDELANLTNWFGIYNATLGVDGSDAVNDYVDVLKKWGIASEDNAENLRTIHSLMGGVTAAQQQSDVTATELVQHLNQQAGSFQALGLNINESLSLMVAYRDAGGDVSEITRAMDTVIQKLAGETDDLDGCWQSIISTFETTDNKMDALSATVGNTGKTVQDVLGKKVAGKIYDTFHNGGVEMDKFTKKIEDGSSKQHNALQKAYQNSRTDMDNFSQWFHENFSKNILGDWNAMEEAAESSTEGTAEAADKSGAEIKHVAGDTRAVVVDEFGNVKGVLAEQPPIGLNASLGGLKTTSDDAFEHVNAGYNALKHNLANNPIKLKVQAPAIEYQTFGNGNNVSMIPTEARRMEFAQAYDQAMILSAPTIFGAMGNQLLVGGDRPGNEVVVGERHLMEMFTSAVKRAGTSNINIVVNGAEGQNVEQLADIVIDKLQNEIINSEATYA